MAKQSPCTECKKAQNQCHFKSCSQWAWWFKEEWRGIRTAAEAIKKEIQSNAAVTAGNEPQQTETQKASKYTAKNKHAKNAI